MRRPRWLGVPALLFFVAGSSPAPALPDAPAIDRDVALIEGDQFTRPHIPPLRTSADGRVGISPKPIDGKVRFYLMVPERLAEPFTVGSPGDQILSTLTPFELPESRFHDTHDPTNRHYTICDTTGEFYVPGELTSPYACGMTRRDDCYDLVVITSTGLGSLSEKRQLWGTPVTVRVVSPKTAAAAIAEVTTGAPRAGAVVQANVLFEPMTTNDGHLLVGRIATSDFEWVNPRTNEEWQHDVDLVYSFGDGAEPCDVNAWTTLHPVSHAPYDPHVNSRYGFAMHPFRDAIGKLVPDGADLGVSYPWIDRLGNNLFFTAVGASLSFPPLGLLDDGSPTRHPARCVPGTACRPSWEALDRTRGQGIVGLWTKGKMVLLDGILNNTDYGIGIAEEDHRLVELYRPGSGPRGDESGEVRVGSGRDVSNVGGPPAYIHNTTIVDSIENRFQLLPNLRPVTPRDVTWIVDSGKASDEIVFDDWLDLDAFIVSEMVGATSYEEVAPGHGQLSYYDGWRDGAFRDPARVQNAATALPSRWRVPSAGIAHGDVRLEPVALGGIRGKGLWLDGQSGIEYEVPVQPTDVEATPWYFGIFLDARFDDDAVERTLVAFPDGAHVRIRGRSAVLFVDRDGNTTHEFDLVQPMPEKAWTHLGVQLQPKGAGVALYVDGFMADFRATDAPFGLCPGSLFVGDDPRDSAVGVRGWIDRFLVIARELGPEEACNHAGGTLAGLTETGGSAGGTNIEWIEVAQRYPPLAHERIEKRLVNDARSRRMKYVCFHGYRDDHEAHLANLPNGLRSVRRELLFPEGPLAYGQPRPDSSSNPFCMSCHSVEGKGGLGIGALAEYPGLPMEDDPRRQPQQPFRRVFGNVPPDWLGRGNPSNHVEAPPAGLKVDGLLLGVIDTVDSSPSNVEVCIGDCNGDRTVAIDELVLAVSAALGNSAFATCRSAFECAPTDTSCLSVDGLIRAVINALDGCSPLRP